MVTGPAFGPASCFPGKTLPQTEHKKHYRTLEMGRNPPAMPGEPGLFRGRGMGSSGFVEG